VDKEANSVTTIDLLADVIVYPNYFVKVMDLDELSEAHKTGLINDDQLHKALEITNILVSGDVKENFDRFQIIIDKYIDNM
jgi:predicted RNA-binding protein associated with RNAse of E/G family